MKKLPINQIRSYFKLCTQELINLEDLWGNVNDPIVDKISNLISDLAKIEKEFDISAELNKEALIKSDS